MAALADLTGEEAAAAAPPEEDSGIQNGVEKGIMYGSTMGLIKGHAGSSDYRSDVEVLGFRI